MANLKELRGRIKSVASIAQITRAMEMVASMKLRKVQAKAQSFHPYVDEIRHLIEAIAAKVSGEGDVPLFRSREVKTVGFFVVASDRGLCGSYNSNLLFGLKKVVDGLQAAGKQVKFWVYGKKAYAWLTRRGFQVERFFVEPPLDKADFAAAKLVGQALVDAFTGGAVDEVRLWYTRFQSMIRFVPTDAPFLPAAPQHRRRRAGGRQDVRAGLPDRARRDDRVQPAAAALPRDRRVRRDAAVADQRTRQPPHGDEGRDRRRRAHAEGPQEGLQPRPPREHHQGAARHRRRRLRRQLS